MKEKLQICLRLLTDVLADIEGDEPQLPPEAVENLKNRICLNCKLPIPADGRVIRGCDEACAKRVSASIRKYEMTEREAIENGIYALKVTAGRKKIGDDALGKLLSEKTAKQDAAEIIAEADRIQGKPHKPSKSSKKKAN